MAYMSACLQCNNANCNPFPDVFLYCLSWNKKHIWSLSNLGVDVCVCVCIVVVYIAMVDGQNKAAKDFSAEK